MIKLVPILSEIKIIGSKKITAQMLDDLFAYIPIMGHGDQNAKDYENIKLKYQKRYFDPLGEGPYTGMDMIYMLPKEALVNYYYDILNFCKKYGFI